MIVTCPSSDQGQMSSFSAESGWASETSSLRSDQRPAVDKHTDAQCLLHLPTAVAALTALTALTALATRPRWFARRSQQVRCPPLTRQR